MSSLSSSIIQVNIDIFIVIVTNLQFEEMWQSEKDSDDKW